MGSNWAVINTSLLNALLHCIAKFKGKQAVEGSRSQREPQQQGHYKSHTPRICGLMFGTGSTNDSSCALLLPRPFIGPALGIGYYFFNFQNRVVVTFQALPLRVMRIMSDDRIHTAYWKTKPWCNGTPGMTPNEARKYVCMFLAHWSIPHHLAQIHQWFLY